MILGNFKFLGVPSDSINLEGIKRFMADDENAKRIHFAILMLLEKKRRKHLMVGSIFLLIRRLGLC